jgi:hypothetical protein
MAVLIVCASAICAAACLTCATIAHASSWHVNVSFGNHGVAGLPVRERLGEPPNQGAPSPPERYRSLLIAGPKGSVFVGGYANSKPGAFLLSRVSATGKLVTSFGHGGVLTVPAIYWYKQAPPRLLAGASGGLLVVGINHRDQFVTVKLNANGQLDHAFGHNGIAQYNMLNSHHFTIVTAAALQANGNILAVYQKELPQPENQPRVPEGQGNGAIRYLELLPSGALDRTFANNGYQSASGAKPQLIEGESGTIGACAETLAANGSLLVAYQNLGLEQLSPAGTVVSSLRNTTYHFCNGLFALPDGGVEGIAPSETGSGSEVTRLTAGGTPQPEFGTAGTTRIRLPAQAATIATNGETFTAGQSQHQLVLSGILPNGQPDPTLGGASGRAFSVRPPHGAGSVPGNEEAPTWEMLATANTITIRIGEEVARLTA